MSDLERELEAAAQVERLRLARLIIREEYRREREYRSPVNSAGRALHGLWRSIITGGWE